MSLRALITLAYTLLACGCAKPDKAQPPDPGAKACTEEAMVCPDGSAVGRTGPDCTFPPCPGAVAGPPSDPSAADQAASRECPPPGECTGPRPLAPNSPCPDGKTMSGPYCADSGDGKCGWAMRACPP